MAVYTVGYGMIRKWNKSLVKIYLLPNNNIRFTIALLEYEPFLEYIA